MTDPDRSVETSRAVLAHLAVHDFPTRSPLYAAIARAALDDDEVLGLTAGVRGHELPPMLLRPAWVGEGIESGAVDCADSPQPAHRHRPRGPLAGTGQLPRRVDRVEGAANPLTGPRPAGRSVRSCRG